MCNKCNKHFSQKSSLTKHKKNVHDKKFIYQCPDCTWGSDDKDEYHTHRKRKHGMIRRIKETGEVKKFVCDLCKKTFDGANLLRRHTNRGTCQLRKRHQCPECLKMYITLKKRDEHVNLHHTSGAPTWVCPNVKKLPDLLVHI